MIHAAVDLIVVGSGAAGLTAALRAAELGARVSVFSASQLLAGSSPRAQGGIAAAIGPADSAAQHAADTLAVGAGLNDIAAVDVLTDAGGRAVKRLRDAGVPFEADLGLEAGHSQRRIVHAGGGATGRVLTNGLLELARAEPRIRLSAHSPVTSLERQADRVVGVRVGRQVTRSHAVILATGGYAALWGRTTNAPETRGEGLALAWRAGASLADLEFVQFHPTALSLADRPAFLLSEALRGEGARLIDADGRPVVDPLLPRDVLARTLYRHIQAGGRVFLSLQHLDPARIEARFGNLAGTLRGFGLDLARDRLPVAPAAHYCMGGVRTDTCGRTDVAGLYAAGEAACSGVQGANRLASNSLLECLVFGERAAEAALSDGPGRAARWSTVALAPTRPPARVDPGRAPTLPSASTAPPLPTAFMPIDRVALGARLDADVGVERDAARLQALLADLPDPEAATPATPDGDERSDAPDGDERSDAPDDDERSDACDAGHTAVLLAALITRAALQRPESRGAHFRIDAPAETPDPAWRGRIHWRRGAPPTFEKVDAAGA